MRKLFALLGLLVLLVSSIATSTPANAAAGGPVILMGLDAEDAFGTAQQHGPITVYEDVVNNMLDDVTNGGSGILVIGGGKNASDDVTRFWDAIATGTGHSVTYVNGDAAIAGQPFAGFALLAVVSDDANTPIGGLTSSENTALIGRSADVATFVNNGGGLLGFSATGFGADAYRYLGDIGDFTFSFPSGGYSDITPTNPAGLEAGITDDLDVCCWHDQYETFPAFLQVLATNALTGKPAAIGGANVVISEIQLAPANATRNTGTSHTVTATVTENDEPLAGETVTFDVLSGPHAGTAGTAPTDSNGEASFSYTGTATGVDTIAASFVDSDGNVQPSNQVEVEWVNSPPVVDAGGPYSGDEGSPIALSGDASDPDGDMLALLWSVAPGAGVDAGATCSFDDAGAVATSITCTDDGEYTLTLEADDGQATESDSATLTVANVAPSVGPITAPEDPVEAGTEISMSAPFSDPGANDTHTATVDWGDGTTSAATVESGAISGSHTYETPGIYTLEAVVTDDDGGVGSAIFEFVVVYDPDAGFVTGGGWIDSPAGAYAADPNLTGRANFGFVSKYKKGATIPTGETEFQFQAGDLNFHITEYEWLVIAGPKAQFKGSGTINQSGDYGFMLTANDSQVAGGGVDDLFRMRIWNKATDQVVYDNQMGDADNADAATELQGGNIVIHKGKNK